MGKVCINCGYERQVSDISPYYECPKCGTIYTKAEKALEAKKKKEAAEAAEERERIERKRKKREELLSLPRKIFKSSDNEGKKINKKILISAIIAISLISGSVAYLFYLNKIKQEYIVKISLANVKMNEAIRTCMYICNTYSLVWRASIEDHSDDDFNDNILRQKKDFESSGMLKNMGDIKDETESILRKLVRHKKILPECHAKIVELYGIYSQIYSLAISPSGSLVSFNNKINELENNFTRVSDELKILLP